MERWPRQTTCSEAGNCQWVTPPVYTASAASAVNVAHFPVGQGRALELCLLLWKGRAKRVAICHVHGPDLPHLCTPSSLLSLEQTLRYLRCYWSTWSVALYNRSWWCRDFPDAGQPIHTEQMTLVMPMKAVADALGGCLRQLLFTCKPARGSRSGQTAGWTNVA